MDNTEPSPFPPNTTFPSLSTIHLADPAPIILHLSSCCPTMDVSLLSSPTNSGSTEASLQLYRLSASASASVSNNAADSAATSSSRVWHATFEETAPLAPNQLSGPATDTSGSGKAAASSSSRRRGGKGTVGGKARTSGAMSANRQIYIQPRLPESVLWAPDGQMLAFASSTTNLRLYSVHDGKTLLSNSPLASSDSSASSSLSASPNSLYLVSWQECIPPEQRIKREKIMAEELGNALPGLPAIVQQADDANVKAKKTNIFANPFLPGFQKPYVPAVPLPIPPFPTLARTSPLSPGHDEPTAGDESENDPTLTGYPIAGINGSEEAIAEHNRLADNPTLLTAGDEKGRLHLLLGGAISLGSIALGKHTDIISCFVQQTLSHPRTPFSQYPRHALQLSLLVSVPTPPAAPAAAAAAQLPAVIHAALSARSTSSPNGKTTGHGSGDVQHVLRCTIELPSFPSSEITLLARAATQMKSLLAHALEAFDEARKAWEEARELQVKWLDRLKDDCETYPELQLLLLLLTGRPGTSSMHDYLAGKNTERNLERWEGLAIKAVIKLRNVAYQGILPVCERLMIWLNQLRGWAMWQKRFAHLHLDLSQIEECIALVKLLMKRASHLEALALEEEIGFRAFAGWLKYELERIAGLEANSDSRPAPKHDVLAVMTYIKTKLPQNPIDPLVKVEWAKDTGRYVPAMEAWLAAQTRAGKTSHVKEEGEQGLADLLATLSADEGQEAFDRGSGAAQAADPVGIHPIGGEAGFRKPFQMEQERLFTDAPALLPPAPPSSASANTRRKSASASAIDPALLAPVIATELPIPYYLSTLSQRLAAMCERSFRSVGESAIIKDVRPVVAWRPEEREEDDSLAALGLARDPTKITSRVVGAPVPDDGTSHWIACETPPGVLAEEPDSPEAFWVLRSDNDGALYGMPFTLLLDAPSTLSQSLVDVQILDIEFFDDQEVALLLRFKQHYSASSRHCLATIKYGQLELERLDADELSFKQFQERDPLPTARVHHFPLEFEPLQFALNGRQGRRVGCVLGNGGKTLEVLDMDVEENDDDDAEGQDGSQPMDALPLDGEYESSLLEPGEPDMNGMGEDGHEEYEAIRYGKEEEEH